MFGSHIFSINTSNPCIIAACGDDPVLSVVNMRTLKVTQLQGHSGSLWDVKFSPSGMLLASSSDDRTVIVRDGATYDVVRTLTNHTAPVHALAFSSSGDFLASGSADNTAVITRVSGGVDHIIRTFRGHIAPVVSLCFSFDGHVLYTASADTTIRLWDIATQAPLVIHRFPEGFATTVPKAVKDGRLLFAGSSSGFINFWKSNQEKPLRSLKLSPLAVNSIEIIPETSEILVVK